MSDEDLAIIASQAREITSLKERLSDMYRRARALTNENQKRAEYINQLLRQTQWLVGELREAREEARTKQKFNQMYVKASGKHQGQLMSIEAERDEAFRMRDAALVLLAKASITSSSTEKE